MDRLAWNEVRPRRVTWLCLSVRAEEPDGGQEYRQDYVRANNSEVHPFATQKALAPPYSVVAEGSANASSARDSVIKRTICSPPNLAEIPEQLVSI